MAHLYESFQEEDSIGHENDEDIGALGSILSWDDEDPDETGDDGSAGSEDDCGVSTGGVVPPPDMVQFSMKDGVPQFNFLSGMNGEQTMQQQQPQQLIQQQPQQQAGDNEADLTMQLPMPTPIATMQDTETATNQVQQPMMNTAQMEQQNVMPPAQDNAQQSQQALAATFAQFLSQQFQQQQQQQQQHVPQQQQQQVQRAPQQQQQVPQPQASQQIPQQQQQNDGSQGQLLQSFLQSNLQQSAGSLPQQAQQQQQQPAMQLPFTADPNAFLQQLQFAQLQQQMQFAQQHQQNQQQQQQQQNQQQQAQGQRKRPPSSAPVGGATQFASQGRPPLPVVSTGPRATTGQPPTKKSKITKPPATKGKSKTKTTGPTAKAGIVSASDTDGEGSKRSKKKAAAAAAAAAASASSNMSGGEESPHANDKAKANRDRNREHARNTRLRKKAYLEKLKTTVDDLCKERDTLVSERAGASNLLVEMHNTRTEVLMSFFALRSTNEKRRKLWSSILDESCFSCVMPVTPYRSFPASEVQVSKCQRTLLGIDGMMADTASLHVLFSSMVDRAKYPDAKIEFRYTLVTEESVVAGNQMMARWVMTTTNATEYGARMEVQKQGMLCCKFNSSHRIIGLELMFDVMAFMLQLKQAAGTDNFPVIPNTVQTCQRLFDKPMVLTLAEPPYTIVQVNKLWEDMTEYSAEEVVGKASCKILQGQSMERKNLDELMQEVRFKRSCSTTLSNVKKSGQHFRHFVVVYPLSTDSRITHYLALSSPIPGGGAPKNDQQAIADSQAQPLVTSLAEAPSATFAPGAASQSTRTSQQPQQNSTVSFSQQLMNSSQNQLMMQSQSAPMSNFSLSMAPPPCRK